MFFGFTTVAVVERMDNAEDVERLFSWLSAPMVHYREFAPKVDVAEAVAAWPLAHRAAAESGMDVGGVVPHGGAAAHERVARDQMGLPAIVAQALHDNAGAAPPNLAPTIVDRPRATTDGLVAALGQRVHATNLERAEGIHAAVPTEPLPPAPLPPAPPPPAPPPAPPLIRREAAAPPVEPVIAGFEEPTPAAPPLQSRSSSLPPLIQDQPRRGRQEPDPPSRAPAAAPGAPDGDRGLFRDEPRARDDRAAGQIADRQDRSLGAVFDRLSGGRERLPDPRNRGRTAPGLGSIFNRPR